MTKVSIGIYGMVPVALLQEDWLTMNALKVYAALASFQGRNAGSWPSREEIMKRSGLPSVRKVSASTTLLEEYGWIEKKSRKHKHQTTIYRVLVATIDESVEESDVPETGRSEESDVPETGRSDVPETGTSSYYVKEQRKRTTTDGGKELVAAGEEKDLTKFILNAFTEHTPITSPEYPREGAAAKRIGVMLREMSPHSPRDAAGSILSHFLYMIEHGDGFWHRQPYRASTLVSGGIWSRVINDMRSKASRYEDALDTSDFTEGLWQKKKP